MKPREQRRKVLIRARMCVDGAWSDACILNLSSQGLGLQCASPPRRGSYVEIRRGAAVVIARVIWAKGHRLGVKSQHRLPLGALSSDAPIANAAPAPRASGLVERRSTPRMRERHDHSRFVARAGEFSSLAVLGAFAATLLYGAASNALATPLSLVSVALGR